MADKDVVLVRYTPELGSVLRQARDNVPTGSTVPTKDGAPRGKMVVPGGPEMPEPCIVDVRNEEPSATFARWSPVRFSGDSWSGFRLNPAFSVRTPGSDSIIGVVTGNIPYKGIGKAIVSGFTWARVETSGELSPGDTITISGGKFAPGTGEPQWSAIGVCQDADEPGVYYAGILLGGGAASAEKGAFDVSYDAATGVLRVFDSAAPASGVAGRVNAGTEFEIAEAQTTVQNTDMNVYVVLQWATGTGYTYGVQFTQGAISNQTVDEPRRYAWRIASLESGVVKRKRGLGDILLLNVWT